ncbi:hypothetical protein Bca101_044722 [Brassica carinata]
MSKAKGGDKVTDKHTSVPDAMISEMQELYEARHIIPSLQNQCISYDVVSLMLVNYLCHNFAASSSDGGLGRKGPGFLRRQSGHGSGKRFSDDVMKPAANATASSIGTCLPYTTPPDTALLYTHPSYTTPLNTLHLSTTPMSIPHPSTTLPSTTVVRECLEEELLAMCLGVNSEFEESLIKRTTNRHL